MAPNELSRLRKTDRMNRRFGEMSANLLPEGSQIVSQGTDGRAASAYRAVLRALVERESDRHPLVIAFAAPIGTRLDPIISDLKESVSKFGYAAEEILLSDLLLTVPNAPWHSGLPRRGDPNYYESRMDAGDQIRRDTDFDGILGALAVGRIAEARASAGRPTAYLLRSLKHPEEARLLRHIYGDAFWLVGVVSSPNDRLNDFAQQLSRSGASFQDSKARAQKLIDRDENDQAEVHGQHVLDVFAMADVFIPSRRGHEATPDIERFLDGIFGKPIFTPVVAEEAMKIAHTAGLRSASMGRQVGAVLVPLSAAAYVTGTNEVPKPGGGQFWAGDDPDYRDFQMGEDPNPTFTATMLQEFFVRLREHRWLTDRLTNESPARLFELASRKDEQGESVLKGTRAESVIEFTRCLHAEQAAIVNAARQGVSTQDSLLFTTTFPCHECAKFIVGAGVRRVIYIEPYPKSMVRHLYQDLIDARPPLPTSSDPELVSAITLGKVPFSAFVGFAPHRYDEIFVGGERRVGTEVARFDRPHAVPCGRGWNEGYVHEKEVAAFGAATALLGVVYEAATSAHAAAATGGRRVAASPAAKPQRVQSAGAGRRRVGKAQPEDDPRPTGDASSQPVVDSG